MKLVYPAVFRPCLEKEGYTAIVPDLPGCVTEGNTLGEAILMGEDAASGWVLDELEDGKPAPTASESTTVNIAPGEFVKMLVLDIDTYAEKFGSPD